MKKVLKYVIVSIFLVCLCAGIFAFSYFFVSYASADVDFNKSKITDSNLYIELYDNKNVPIKHTHLNGEYIALNLIPKHTIDAFLTIEDKDFYSHNGLNYKRMVSAMVKNITSFKFKEGASTISQQLIKNTHLSSKKTFKRKINEIKLTKKLEKEFTKDQILEYYLNIIYFGDNCYGIQNASEHYFSHSASKLTIDESALLAGIIKSPNKYHPIKNYSSCIKRRNLILSELKKDNKITENEYSSLTQTKTNIVPNSASLQMSAYAKSAIEEASNILKLPAKQIAIGGYKIYTYNDTNKQFALENCYNKNEDADISLISINAKTGAIEAYAEKSALPLINVKRQPASSIKPVLVYAPAINENIITPSTEILDDKISINGYTPKNIGDKNYGYVSVENALSNSLNIPAVKILSYVGIEKAKSYLERQNITFDKEDNNLSIALGGMTYGTTLKDLTNLYQTLANEGKHISSKFINYICDKNGKVIYKNNAYENTIYRDDTAFLVTNMLQKTAKKGTAKRLSDLTFEVASKTGTSSITKNNLDAYNISYTTEDVVGCWMGKIDNSPIDIVGGGAPTLCVKKYLNAIYKEKKPLNFKIPNSIVTENIDTMALKNEHVVYLASDFLPDRFKQPAYFSRFNIPQTKSFNTIEISPPKIDGFVKNGVANINFTANEYCTYELYQITTNGAINISSISPSGNKAEFLIPLDPNKYYEFYVVAKIMNYKTNKEIFSESSNIIKLISKQ